MTSPVHILATVRRPELIEAALLVFRTLRTGFPTAEVTVWGNGLAEEARQAVGAAAATAGARFANVPGTCHDVWIEELLARATAPFWICDTDMVFFGSLESKALSLKPGTLCAGRHEPEFNDEVTGCVHAERLHTCLMWFNPGPLRAAMRAKMAKVVMPWRQSAEFAFVRQMFLMLGGQRWLYDTCTGIFQAGLGTRFSAEQDAAFEHLHCGTYLDEAAKRMKCGAAMAARHAEIYHDPSLAMGLRAQQTRYYQAQRRD